jgi:hypothetical protein
MAGELTAAYATESSYLGGVGGTPTYRLPGSDIRFEDTTLQNFLASVRNPDAIFPTRQVRQQVEGVLGVSFTLTDATWFGDLVANATDGSGNDVLEAGHVPSAEWYLGLEYPDSTSSTATVERQIQGWTPVDVTVAYNTTELVRVTLTGPYGDEQSNTSVTPGTISGGGDEVDFHGTSFTFAGGTPYSASLNSLELSLSNLARLSRGTDKEPSDAWRAAPEGQLTLDADIRTADTLAQAYGGTTSDTSPQDLIDGISASLAFDTGGSTVFSVDLEELKADEYAWESLMGQDANPSESATLQLGGDDPDGDTYAIAQTA